jgi:hypothetical protein
MSKEFEDRLARLSADDDDVEEVPLPPEGYVRRDFTADDPHAIVVEGVRLSSRYNRQSELDLLTRVIMALDADQRRRIGSIFVDSKGCAFYTIWFRPEDRDAADPVARAVADKLIELAGGYNGVDWYCDGSELGWLDPYWKGDEEGV